MLIDNVNELGNSLLYESSAVHQLTRICVN